MLTNAQAPRKYSLPKKIVVAKYTYFFRTNKWLKKCYIFLYEQFATMCEVVNMDKWIKLHIIISCTSTLFTWSTVGLYNDPLRIAKHNPNLKTS